MIKNIISQNSWLGRAVTSFWFKLAIAAIIIWLLVYFNRIGIIVLASLAETWPWLLVALLLTHPLFCIVSYRFKVILFSQGIDAPFHWTRRAVAHRTPHRPGRFILFCFIQIRSDLRV